MIYVASPYTHQDPSVMRQRGAAAVRYAASCIRRGETVFSPIAHGIAFTVSGGDPISWDEWMRVDLAILRLCSTVRVLALPGWEDSRGVAAEVAEARRCGIPVEYVDADGRPLDIAGRSPAGVIYVLRCVGCGRSYLSRRRRKAAVTCPQCRPAKPKSHQNAANAPRRRSGDWGRG